MNDSRAIAIVGMSCVFPGCPSLEAFWDCVRAGRSHFREVPPERWNHAQFFSTNPREHEMTYAKKVACLDDLRSFAPEHFGMPPRRAYPMDPQQRLMLSQAWLALEDAGYTGRRLPASTGVYIGASVSEYKDLVVSRLRSRQVLGGQWGSIPDMPEDAARQAVRDVSAIQQYSMVGVLLNMIACNISEAFDLQGPSSVMDAACSSALVAVHEAVLHLREGICDAALVGGVYSICSPDMMVGFSRIGALSRSDVCRPFDRRADGFVLGEGSGAVVLKRLADAKRDGDHIWAVIRGVGLNNDGRGEGPMTPRLSGQVAVLARAYKDAQVSPSSVGYIEAHGTATPVGDMTELSAIRDNLQASGDSDAQCAVTSVKGNIGHTLAAAGMAGLIKSVLALNEAVIPPQAGWRSLPESIQLDGSGLFIPSSAQAFKNGHGPRRAGVNAFGFGGTNVHVVLEEPPARNSRVVMTASRQPAKPQLFVISAAKPALLAQHLSAIAAAVAGSEAAISDLAFTLTVARRLEEARVAFLARDKKELLEKLGRAVDVVNGASHPDIRYSPKPAPAAQRKVAFIFPGDAALSAHLRDSLARQFSSLQERFAGLGHSRKPANGNGTQADAPSAQQVVADFLAEFGISPQVRASDKEDVVRTLSGVSSAGVNVIVQVGGDEQRVREALASLGLDGRCPELIPVASAQQDSADGLLLALGHLAVLGVTVRLAPLHSHAALVRLPSAPLSVRPFWVVQPKLIDDTNQSSAPPGSAASVSDESKPEAPQPEAAPTAEAAIESAITTSPSPRLSMEEDSVLQERVAGKANEIRQRVLEEIAKVSSYPLENLQLDQRLGPDLGFDSLMSVDLFVSMKESILGGLELPESLIDSEMTIAGLVEAIARALVTAAAEPATATADTEIRRHVVAPVARPLPPRPRRAELPFAGRVLLIAEQPEIARLLAALLSGAGRKVDISSPEEIRALDSATAVIDLCGLNGAQPRVDAARMSSAALALMQRAARISSGGKVPSAFIVAHSGLATAGLTGVAKALGKEWPQALVRAIEFEGSASTDVIAQTIFDEVRGTDACAEVSYTQNGRQEPLYTRQPVVSRPLKTGAVVAISGGGRGLGAKVALELARRYQARLLLLGRSANSEIVDAVRAAGGNAIYAQCDVRDPQQVAQAFQRGREEFGAVEHVIHAAGILADAPLASADAAQSVAVLETKLAGAQALWRMAAGDPLKSFVMFGSWAGRFGNAHQADYSAANHTLARLASAFGSERPQTHVVTLDLPPWEGSSMVNSMPEAARKALRGRVQFLTDETGLEHILAELGADGPSGEILLGALPEHEPRTDVAVIHLSPAELPWLEDHKIDGRIVVPYAFFIDQAAAAAQRLGLGHELLLSDSAMLAYPALPAEGAASLKIVSRRAGESADIRMELITDAATETVFSVRAANGSAAARLADLPRDGKGPQLSLADFYGSHTFHGPALRALAEVSEVGSAHAAGLLDPRTRVPGEVLDIAVTDGMLQLCAFWAATSLGRMGLPLGAEEIRVSGGVVAGQALRVVGKLDQSSGESFAAHLDLLNSHGAPLLQMRGLRCKLRGAARTDQAAAKPRREIQALAPAAWKIEEFPEVRALMQRFEVARVAGLSDPYFSVHEGVTNDTSQIGGREYINFASYNYLGLSGRDEVNAAVAEAVKRYGTSVSASRLASGEKPLHRELEHEIADFLGCEDSVVMVSGHATNVSTIGCLLGPEDLVAHDSFAHDSILAGIRLAGAKRRPFPHNDADALEEILRQSRHTARRVLIAVEGVYSMDGDIAPLARIVEIKQRHHALLLVDEAHSLGVLGRTGRGVGEHAGVNRADVDLWMGTLSKSLASCGGYIAGSALLVRYLKYSNPGFVYSVGISPANAAASLAALRIMRAHPELVTTLHERSRFFLERSRALGINTGRSSESAVVPCIVGNSMHCLQLAQALRQRAINVQPILYPAVEESQARLRFFVTARHSEQQLAAAAEAVAEELAAIAPEALLRPSAAYPATEDRARHAAVSQV
jgi:8-amino-7-oxononanoate synthase